MHKYDVLQYVSDIKSDIMVTEFPNQMKNEQASIAISGINRMPRLEIDAEENSLIIVKWMNDKGIPTLKVPDLV